MDYGSWSLDNWVGMFNQIYGKHNLKLSDEQIWLRMVEEVAGLAEALRKQHITPRNDEKGRLQGALANIPDAFAWLSAFSFRYGSLEDMTWHKFPGVCPYCFVEKNCVCISQKPSIAGDEGERRLEEYRKAKQNHPITLYGWQEMFDRIYGSANRIQSVEQVGFHLMEEVGEVAKSIRLEDILKLKNELADVLAWIIGITIKSGDLVGEEYRLDNILWERYQICVHIVEKIPV